MTEQSIKRVRLLTKVCQCPWGDGVEALGEVLAKLECIGKQDAFVTQRVHSVVARVEGFLGEVGLHEDGKDFSLVFCESAKVAMLCGFCAVALAETIQDFHPATQYVYDGTRKAEDEGDADDVAIVVVELGEAHAFYHWLRQHKECCGSCKNDIWCFLRKKDFEQVCKVFHGGEFSTLREG